MYWVLIAVLVAVSTMNYTKSIDFTLDTYKMIEDNKTNPIKEYSSFSPSYILIKTLKEKHVNDSYVNYIIVSDTFQFKAVNSLDNQNYIKYISKNQLENLDIEELIYILF